MVTNNLLINNSIVEDEKDIKTGLMQSVSGIFIIGRALNRIKEGKKYKTELGYNTFEDYLEQRVGFSRMTGYRYVEIANKLSENVTARLQNFSIRKLYLIASAVENEQQAIEFIEEKHIIDNKEKPTEDMTTRELEKVVKEKKEIKKQLQAEQEYSEELQQAIKEKEQKIKALQNEIENIQIPEKEIIEKEVIKEVIPENLILEKQKLENELETLRKRTEKAENTLSRMKLDKEINQEKVYSNTKLEHLLVNIKNFLDSASKYTYLKDELQKIPAQNRKILESKINEVESWTILMKQALRNEENIVGNVIFGEGEIINE